MDIKANSNENIVGKKDRKFDYEVEKELNNRFSMKEKLDKTDSVNY
jgi:hypothetical protein